MNRFDFIVIGSGPSGMLSASILSEKYKVCLIERGERSNPKFFSSFSSFEKNYDNIIPVFSQNIFGFGQAKCFGGGSVINGALIWNLPEHTKQAWQSTFGKEFVDNICKNYIKIKEILSVKDSKVLNKLSGNNDSNLMLHGANKLNWNCISVPRALAKCEHINNCGFGCNNKNSVDVVFKQKLIDNNVKIVTSTNVSKIHLKNKNGLYLETDKRIKFFSKNFILSAGAINSNLLLQRSSITKKSYVQFHLNLKIVAFHKKEIFSENGTMFTHQVQQFIDEGILFMPTNYTKDSFLSSLTHLSPTKRKELYRKYQKGAIYVVQVQPEAIGKIISIAGKCMIFYKLTNLDIEKIQRGVKLILKLLNASGFQTAVIPSKKCNDEIILQNNEFSEINKIKKWEMISVHSMAANRIGLNEKKSICDINGKVFKTNNLYVTDSSSLPSSIGESPQGVIMANTMRIVENL